MTENKGDLISRSELYREIESLDVYGTIDNENDALLKGSEVFDLIDNAPTVERPQGEWIDYSDEGYVECPFCQSATNCEDNKDELHFCWNCGAEMRGDEL